MVAFALAVVALGLAALWRVARDGLLVQHALQVASHHLQLVAPATMADIFLY